MEITSLAYDEPVIYVLDYFMFERLDEKPINEDEKSMNTRGSGLNRDKETGLIDLPLFGCPKAKILGEMKFSLYIPEILSLQIRKSKTNDSETDELMEIVHDRKNHLIRVDDLKSFYEIADLNQKNFFHFQNSAQCMAFFYQENMTKYINLAKSLLDEIYSLKDKKFYHIGHKIIDGNLDVQVFELSETMNDDKNVTTLFMREVDFKF